MDEAGWELWQKRSGATSGSDQVRIYQSGRLAIPPTLLESHFGDHDGIRIYYQPGKIALEPADVDDPDAYTLQRDDRETAIVYCTAFLKDRDLIPESTTGYETTWDEDAGLLIVDVS